jgi:hypothetical protein
MRGRNGTIHRYCYCRGHDLLRARQGRRCPERNIRADELDEYVFARVRQALLDPRQLIAGERAVIAGAPLDENELIAAQLKRLDGALQSSERERTRLLDAYQAGLLELEELTRRTAALTARRDQLVQEKHTLTRRSTELATENRLRRRLAGFAERVAASLDDLDVEGRRRLLRLVVEKVRVTGWRVEIHLKIPLPDDPPDDRPPAPGADPNNGPSSDMRLRSLREPQGRLLPAQGQGPRLTATRQEPRYRVTNHPRRPRRGPQNAPERVIPDASAPKSAETGVTTGIAGTNGTALRRAGGASAPPTRARKRLRAPLGATRLRSARSRLSRRSALPTDPHPTGWSTFHPARVVHFSTGLDTSCRT